MRVEKELCSTISGILGRGGGDERGWGINPNWIIASLMQEAQGTQVRIRIVDAALEPLLEGHSLAESWADLRRRLNQRAQERNVAVHAEWAWSENTPKEIIRVLKNHRYEGWVEQDFIAIFDGIKAVEHDLHEFMKRVLTEINEGRIRVPSAGPEPTKSS